MNRILIYDCSIMGQLLGNYLKGELNARVECVTDIFDPHEASDREIYERVSQKIKAYVDKAASIIIINPLIVTMVAGELEKIFPEQKFIYYGKGIYKDIGAKDKVAILALERVRRTERYQALKAACQSVDIAELDCRRWLDLLEKGWWGKEKIAEDFRHKLGAKILVYHQHLLLRVQKIEEIVDWRGELIDVKREILKKLR